MKHVTLWRVGFVRCIALLVAGGAMHGISHGMRTHAGWNIAAMSLPTASALLLCAIGLYILGYRTERDYAKIVRNAESKRRVHGNHTDRNDDTHRSR